MHIGPTEFWEKKHKSVYGFIELEHEAERSWKFADHSEWTYSTHPIRRNISQRPTP
jgi:hypothetical protein